MNAANDGRNLFGLMLGAMGVVFGDIGTSPLYALKATVLATEGGLPNHVAVMGSLSMIFWALILVVTVKYVLIIMRADNNGEGGTLALAALAHRSPGMTRRIKATIGIGAIVGLALFFGDGMLTPAVTVLSAVEGLKVESHAFAPLVVPLALVILIGLFLIQSRGTHKIGRLFGPVMLLWFLALARLRPGLADPDARASWRRSIRWYALEMFLHAPWVAFVSLGAVVLAVTGCEALYADMGHFGRKPIQYAWLFVALPALMLNYFGQGAALLRHPEQADIAFFSVIPHWAHMPMVVLATLAAIIASQAVITGVFSMTQQAVQLGQLPRMEIRHTSATDYGQIYVPRMNALLAIGVVLIVLIFKSSDALTAAYGIAVTGVMVIDTFNAGIVAGKQWRWAPWLVIVPVRRHGHQRPDLLHRQLAEDPRRRLAALVHRRRRLYRHGHLAARPPRASGKGALRIPAAVAVPGARRQEHHARGGPGRVPVVAHRHRARRPAAQSQAQQGAA